MSTVINQDVATIVPHKEKGYAEITWSENASSEEYRVAMNKLIDVLKENNLTKILADTKGQGAISEEDQKWSYTDWLARAKETGYNKIAILVSEDIFNQISVEEVMSNVADIDQRFFSDKKEAEHWL